MITPEDLKSIYFPKATFGGYDMRAVDDFLEPLLADYLTLFRENAELRSSVPHQKESNACGSDTKKKCNKCGSEWISATIVESCPFCGADLRDEIELDVTSPSSVLAFIIHKYGSDIVRDRKTISLFKDLAPGLKEESMLIGIAVEAGTYTEMLSLMTMSAKERRACLSLCKERLKKQRFLADEFAEKPIRWLSEALGWTASLCSIHMGKGNELDLPTQPANSRTGDEAVHTIDSPQKAILTEKPAIKTLSQYHCPICGYTCESSTAPEKCKICGAPRMYKEKSRFDM